MGSGVFPLELVPFLSPGVPTPGQQKAIGRQLTAHPQEEHRLPGVRRCEGLSEEDWSRLCRGERPEPSAKNKNSPHEAPQVWVAHLHLSTRRLFGKVPF